MHSVYMFQEAKGLLEIINLRELELMAAQVKDTYLDRSFGRTVQVFL